MKKFHPRILNAINREIWAMQPEIIEKVYVALFEYYFSSESDIERIARVEASLGKKLENPKYIPDIRSIDSKRVSLIPIMGIMGKRWSSMNDISGGVSTELLKKNIQDNLNNSEIDAMVFKVDSGGGVLDGTKELTDFVYQSRGSKPMLSYVDGIMGSAAYWFGASTDKITAFDTSEIGSIGVWTMHQDYSKFFENYGITNTIIRSSDFKAVPNKYEAMTPEVRAYVQETVGHFRQMFVDDIVKFRNADFKIVDELWANGKMFPARKALELGLIDQIMTLEETIQMAADMADGTDGEILTRKAALALNDDPILSIMKISYEEAISA